MGRSDERGIALIITLFMVLILSVLGSSLVFVSRTETLSSLNYKTMSQARYGAESGVHRAANHLLFSYTPPNAVELALYNTNVSPVRLLANGREVVLAATAADSNYPDIMQRDAFAAAFTTPLTINSDTIGYDARARLLTMRQIADPFAPGQTITLQTWEITGTGRVGGAGSASVEVSAIVERQAVPLFAFAAFATDPGCNALRFGGGATTMSYDSSDYGGSGSPALDDWGGNVGTNGGLTEIGATTIINGTLSTPRTGVGNCSNGNVTALTTSGGATVAEGLVQLPQSVPYPTPPDPTPMPPTGNVQFNGTCPATTVVYCTGNGTSVTLDPALSGGTIVLGDVRVAANTSMTLKPGVYIVNSINFSGGAGITVDVDTTVVPDQQVILQVAGQNTTTPIDFTGGTITNTTYDPSRLQIYYAGDDNVKLTGGAASAALVYAPNASTAFSGGGQFYGAVVAGKVTDMGGAHINYDRNLENDTLTSGNWTMSSFTWSNF